MPKPPERFERFETFEMFEKTDKIALITKPDLTLVRTVLNSSHPLRNVILEVYDSQRAI